jgi:3-mercaptopyruvate sulfurtransferase SseA
MLYPRSAVIAGLLWIAAGAAAEPTAASSQQTPADPLAAARRISGEEARQAVAKGEAVLVDVRPKESYDAEHAKGAISLPLSELASRMGELPKDKLVITYCT